MGLKDSARAFVGAAEAARNAIDEERARVDALPSVRKIAFKKFSEAQIKTAETVKKPLLGGSIKKKVIESLVNGTAEYADVKCIADFAITIEDRERSYGIIVDSNNQEYQEAILILNGRFFTASASSAPKKCHLVHYYVGKKERFLLVNKNDFSTMKFVLEEIYFPILVHSVSKKVLLDY